MGDYAGLDELRMWIGIDDSDDDPILDLALATAESEVEQFCGRRFTLDSVVSTRWCDTLTFDTVVLPGWDIATTDGLVVATDTNGDGTAETAWTIGTHFRLAPQFGPDGRAGWPYTSLQAVRYGRWFPCGSQTVSITAKWGWPAVPQNVKQATLMLAAEVVKMKDAPLGVAGFGDLGLIRVRENPMVARLLSRYVHPWTAAVVA